MPEERGDWELDALRARLGALEERFVIETESIRRRIDSLEKRRTVRKHQASEASAEAEPVRLVAPQAELSLSVAEEFPADVAMPPPLPLQVRPSVPPQVVERPLPDSAASSAGAGEPVASFELRFGRVWLVRIGIALLVTGLVLLGNYAYRNWIRELPAGVRLAALYGCALALAEAGRRLAKRENLLAFGEVVLAGGLAFFYYCTFAAHHVSRLRVIESPVFAALLLALAAGGIAAVSWLRRARGTAVLGIVLASYAVMLQPIGWMSCFSALVLAGMGLFFASRPGWEVPGWVSLVATYGAFIGWQFLGAARAGVGEPVLWFLPCVWLLFALPTITGRFRGAMDDRAQAWFTGANNGLFFLLYSVAWLMLRGDGRYWLVCGAIGIVLLSCGVLGRRRSEAAGGTYVAQALACLSLALVLKLDGWHLGLSLAGEALALAVAYFRFRGRSELAFAFFAGVASAAIHCGAFMAPADWGRVPAWSAALGAALLLAASHFLWRGGRGASETETSPARGIAALVFACGIAVTVIGWGMRIDAGWRGFALLTVAVPMAGLSFHLDRRREWAEPVFGSLALMVSALLVMWPPKHWLPTPMILALPLALVSSWLWRHRTGENERARVPFTGQVVSAGLAAMTLGIAVTNGDASGLAEALYLCGGGLLLIAAGALLACGALAPAGALLGLVAIVRWLEEMPSGHGGFALFGGLVAMASPLLVPAAVGRIGFPFLLPMAGLLRLAGFAAWALAWGRSNPESWFDWLGVTAVAILLCARGVRREPALEGFGFAILALAGWGVTAVTADFHGVFSAYHGSAVLGGWGLVAALVTLVWVRGLPARPEVAPSLLVAVSFVWTTQATVTAHGWRAVALTWTLLGFLLVCAGLLQRMHLLRVGGFLVIGAALAKVFAVDVWDYTAFLRVVAFLALGVALLVLSLFYHRFAPVLKSLLESEARGNGET